MVPDPTIVLTNLRGNIRAQGVSMRGLSDEQFALIVRACGDSGAFPVAREANDAVLLFPISGIVPARVESASAASGEVLVEAYVLP